MRLAALVLLASTVAFAQPPSAAKATAPTTEAHELALTQLKLAIAEARLASQNAQAAAQQADAKMKEAQAKLESTRTQLGLDSSYEWDMQSETFVKRQPSAQVKK